MLSSYLVFGLNIVDVNLAVMLKNDAYLKLVNQFHDSENLRKQKNGLFLACVIVKFPGRCGTVHPTEEMVWASDRIRRPNCFSEVLMYFDLTSFALITDQFVDRRNPRRRISISFLFFFRRFIPDNGGGGVDLFPPAAKTSSPRAE